jgi:hypothetical protein
MILGRGDCVSLGEAEPAVWEIIDGQRRSIWLSGLEAACRIPKVNVGRLPKIVELRQGEGGLDENLRHWTDPMQ